MDSREITAEYRLAHWAGIMRERKDSGMSVRAYCRQSGYHENVYYYWQRKLREIAIAKVSGLESTEEATPAGWALCSAEAESEASSTYARTRAIGSDYGRGKWVADFGRK